MQTSDNDKRLYAAVAEEIAQGVVDPGIWTKAFAQSGGGEPATKALYIEIRVSELREEIMREREAAEVQARREVQRGQAATCPDCGYRGAAKKEPRGTIGVFLLLLLLGVVPGVLYAKFFDGFRYTCARCGALLHVTFGHQSDGGW